MSKYLTRVLAVVLILALLGGCATAPQNKIDFSSQELAGANQKIGVIRSKIPEVAAEFPGADCLLCIAAALANHSSFRDHVKSLSSSDLAVLHDAVVSRLRAKGLEVVKLSDEIDVRKLDSVKEVRDGFAKNNFSSFQARGLTSLVVVDFKTVGFRRSHQNYFPSEPMKARVVAEVYMVRLADGKLLWFERYDLLKGTSGEWDNKPKFPEITNAFYSLVEEFKDQVIESIK